MGVRLSNDLVQLVQWTVILTHYDRMGNFARIRSQAREAPRAFVGRETHYLWGRRHLLRVTELDAKPEVRLDHRTIHLQVGWGTVS